MGRVFASVCMPAGSVCVATRMCRKCIEMHRCQLCPTLLLQDNTAEIHYKGEHEQDSVSWAAENTQHSRKVTGKWTQLSTNWAIHQDPLHENRGAQSLMKWGSVTDKAGHYITSLCPQHREQSGNVKIGQAIRGYFRTKCSSELILSCFISGMEQILLASIFFVFTL